MNAPAYSRRTTVGMIALGGIIAAVMLASPACGEDGQTWLFTGVTTNLASDLVIGDTGINNALVIDGGSIVGNREAVIGNGAAAGLNTGVVRGPASQWFSSGTLAVGNYGSSNTLTITNGGTVSNATGVLGAWPSAGSNTLVVTGSNSLWVGHYELLAGYDGSGNQLCVNAGGGLSADYTTVGKSPVAGGNAVVLRDSGTLLSNAWALLVGERGSGNTFRVADGARVSHRFGFVGVETNAGDNRVDITGSGTLWTSYSNLTIGVDGHDNKLTIANSGQVVSAVGIVGDYDRGSGNQVFITGFGALWTNAGALTVGNDGSANQVVVTNGGRLVSTAGIIGNGTNAGGNAMVLAGSNSVWAGIGDLIVGNAGIGNTFIMSQGAVLTNGRTWIGFTNTAADNAVWIMETGSTWRSDTLVIGNFGSRSRLTASRGARVFSTGGIIGNWPSSSGNAATIADAGSSWVVSGTLYIGDEGDHCSLIITNGGWVNNTLSSRIGEHTAAANNQVLVAGSGSVWSNGSDLIIGDSGPANLLAILAGGRVYDSYASIGVAASGCSNTVLVAGTGAVWYAGGDLKVGSAGAANSLMISTGGLVRSSTGKLGRYAGSHRNRATVSGAGALWTNTDLITIGGLGAGNALAIEKGGQVIGNSACIVGELGGSDSNDVLISGSGSLLFAATGFTLGRTGSWNTATLSDNGILRTPALTIGSATNSVNNLLTLAGGSLQVTNGTRTGLLDIRSGALSLLSGALTVDRINVAAGGQLSVAAGSDLRSAVNIVNAGIIDAGDGTLFPADVSLSGNGLLRGSAHGTWSFTGDFISTSTNAALDLLPMTLAFTNGADHSLSLLSLDKSSQLVGFSGNQALGALRLEGTLDLVGNVYVGALSGSGVLRIGNLDRFYYIQADDWHGSVQITGHGVFEQVPLWMNAPVVEADSALQLSWPSALGLPFGILWTDELTNHPFTSATNLTGTGDIDTWTDVGDVNRAHPRDAVQRYYRLKFAP